MFVAGTLRRGSSLTWTRASTQPMVSKRERLTMFTSVALAPIPLLLFGKFGGLERCSMCLGNDVQYGGRVERHNIEEPSDWNLKS